MELTIDFDPVDGAEGWIYSYGLTWVLCEDTSMARWWSLVGTAHASHSIVYEGNGEWSWHTPIPLGEASTHLFERRLDPNKYCGISWLFAHGGILREGQLRSLHITRDEAVVASSHHASTLSIPFPEPTCVTEGTQAVGLRIRTADWVASMGGRNTAIATRDAWRFLRDFVEVTTRPCP